MRRWPGILLVLIRLALGGLFLWSGLLKLRQPYDFLASVYQYEIVGHDLGLIAAAVLPIAECILGLCLLSGVCVGGAMLLCVVLFAVFVAAQFWAKLHGLQISCGCFSGAGDPIGPGTIARAAAFLVLAIIGYVLSLPAPALAKEPPSSSCARQLDFH